MKARVPDGLKAKGRRLWTEVTGDYELRRDELIILEDACRTTDLITRMENELAEEPLTVKGSMGQLVPHPHVTELRQYRNSLAGLLARLKLPDESGMKANQQREAAQSRWAQSRGKVS